MIYSNLTHFKEQMSQLKKRFDLPLPGIESQLKWAPEYRQELIEKNNFSEPPRQSAVLILLFPDAGKVHTVFIRRNLYDGVHSGQIAFPGGRAEPEDADLVATALREAEEEIGIDRNQVEVLGCLTKLYIPPSNFDVQPVVGYSLSKPDFIPQLSEVSGFFTVEIDHLMKSETCQTRKVVYANGREYLVPCFAVDDYVIWGATSMVLNEFLELTGLPYR